MRKVITGSDRGMVMFGTPQVRFSVSNNSGDGDNFCYIVKSKTDIPIDIEAKINFEYYERFRELYTFVGEIQGDFCIYRYDCDRPEDKVAARIKSQSCQVYRKNNNWGTPEFYFYINEERE